MAYVTVADRVREIVVDELGLADHVYEPDVLLSYLGADRLRMASITLRVEEAYEIEFEDAVVARMEVPQDIIDGVVAAFGN